MDAVVLANYANEHAPFAIKAMKKGLHVFSEVLPVQNMKEAVELVEVFCGRVNENACNNNVFLDVDTVKDTVFKSVCDCFGNCCLCRILYHRCL